MSARANELAAYAQADHAKTHKAAASNAAEKVNADQLQADWEKLQRDGYVILERVLDGQQLLSIKADIVPRLSLTGRNNFEGHRTQRLYAVLEKTRATDPLVEHPRILALLDRLFLPNYLLSQLQIINILPGESAQMMHFDDAFYKVKRPRLALGAATVWALDDFTGTNGATQLIPGSHLWDDDRVPTADDVVVNAVMPAGSVILFLGTLWHGGGANRSDASRLAATAQYCEPWLRTQENYFLSVSRDTARQLSEDMLRMLGYSIHPPFMGMSNGMSPKRALDPS
ncbi:phytanoyl-CoA dioxygenase family protein [Variovorax gossypii]|uniref:Phytanoyl-CoA dioxygenase family protein n=1 Tax=Variovorax gossypii TaxID=1679495 RepID=A0A431TPD0_9BURK|nr:MULTISPECIES: phytanoyl-CoA dioxygenase family protein [Variovorax]MDR6522115.1 ectoine hydroxylase-related dioxygenase (phytanoyl-CoA dioxygenase family) [Variovorax paradoxus]RTQ35585.1 phytanoyl-CoA dioxygenase family protein [Variovorax gossypii]